MQYCNDCRREWLSWVPRSAYHVLGVCELCERDGIPIFGLHSSIAGPRYNMFPGVNALKADHTIDREWRQIRADLKTDPYVQRVRQITKKRRPET